MDGQPNADPNPEDELVERGVLGDGLSRAGRGNLKLLERAIREDWPISKNVRHKLTYQMSVILDSDSERNKVAAARVLIAADNVNAKREAIDVAASRSPQAINLNVGIAAEGPVKVFLPHNNRDPL